MLFIKFDQDSKREKNCQESTVISLNLALENVGKNSFLGIILKNICLNIESGILRNHHISLKICRNDLEHFSKL